MEQENFEELYERILTGDEWDYSTLDKLIALVKIDSVKKGMDAMKEKAINAFKENCQRPKDTESCECHLCVRWVGRHCELFDGFIEKLNS